MSSEQIVQAFAGVWAVGVAPDLALFASLCGGDAALLEQLVRIDVAERRRRGETVAPADYLARFPGLETTRLEAPVGSSLAEGADSTRSSGNETPPPPVLSQQATVRRPPPTPMLDAFQERADTTAGGRYEVLRPHARGGLGEISIALDRTLHREVAMKTIRAQHADDAGCRDRFILEAEITGSLEHPGIVPVYDFGSSDEGRPYYAMRFIQGATLKQAIDELHQPTAPGGESFTLRLRRLLARFVAVCQTMEYAHSRGVVHRDLKPSNILLGRFGETLVVDWGLAKAVGRRDGAGSSEETTFVVSREASQGHTLPGTAVGTPAYMSPEQAAGRIQQLGPASDIYSLGATLYHILCGRPPIQESDVATALSKAQSGDFPRPRQVAAAISPDLEAICLNALALASHERYATARGLADDVERWLADEPVTVRRPPFFERASRWTRRNRAWTRAAASALAVVLVAGVAAAWLIVTTNSRAASRVAESAQKETRALALSALTASFGAGLTPAEWTVEHVHSMLQLIDEFARLDPDGRPALTVRLRDEFAAALLRDLGRARLTSQEVARLRPRIELLKSLGPESAAAVQAKLDARLQSWETVVELGPPWSDVDAAFPPQTVVVSDGLLTWPGGAAAPQSPRLATRIPAQGDVRVTIQLTPPAADAARFGLELSDGAQRYGAFLLRAGAEAESPAGGRWFLQLQQNELILRKQVVADDVVARGCELRIERRGARLAADVGAGDPLVFQDPFAPPAGGEPQLTLHWPPGISLQKVKAERLLAPPQASPLERGDGLYAAGRFEEALAEYEGQPLDDHDEDLQQEIRFKRALCLRGLQRTAESRAALQTLMNAPSGEWAARAACEVWRDHVEHARWDDAEAAFVRISATYRFEDLATLISADARVKILQSYLREFETLSTVFRHNPNRIRNVERAAAVHRLLTGGDARDYQVQFQLIRAYMFAGDNASALPLAEELFEHHGDFGSLRNLVRLLCDAGRDDEALAALSRFIAKVPPNQAGSALGIRARVYARLEDWDEAERSLADSLTTPSEIDPGGALLQGYLQERTGRAELAFESWKRGYEQFRDPVRKLRNTDTRIPQTLLLGSWTQQITPAEAAASIRQMLGTDADAALLDAMQGVWSEEQFGATLIEMWRTPRGRRIGTDAYILETLTLRDRARLPAQLLAYQMIKTSAFDGVLSAAEDELVWQVVEDLYGAFLDRGEVSVAQLAPLLLAWKGNLGPLGWGGVSFTLKPAVRARFAYLLAHRCLSRGDEPGAVALLQLAQREADLDLLDARVKEELQLLQDHAGRLAMLSHAPVPALLDVTPAGGLPARRVAVVDDRTVLDLPAGEYRISAADAASIRLDPEVVRLTPGREAAVSVEWNWEQGPGQPIPGLIPRPARLPGIANWQLRTHLPPQAAWSLCPAPDDGVACGLADGTVCVYGVNDGRLRQVFTGLSHQADAVDVSPDGARLTAGGAATVAYLWDWSQPGRPTPLFATSTIVELRWSPDSRQIAAACLEGGICVWDAEKHERKILAGHQTRTIAWRPDGAILTSGGLGGRILNWRPQESAEPTVFAEIGPVAGLAWSPDGKMLAVAAGEDQFHLLDADGKLVRKWDAGQSGLASVAWSRDGRLVATGGQGNVRVWNTAGELQSAVTPTASGNYLRAVVWTPAGLLLTADPYDYSTYRIWDQGRAQTSPPVAQASHSRVATRSQGVTTIAFASRPFRTWNANGSLRHQGRDVSLGGHALACRPDDRRIAVGSVHVDASGQATTLYSALGVLQQSLALGAVRDLAWNAHGQLASGGTEGVLRIWQSPDGPTAELPGHTASINRLAWNPDGSRIVTAGFDGTLRSWNAASGKAEQVVEVPGGVWDVDWSSRDKIAASSGNRIRIFNGDLTGPVEISTGSAFGVELAWSPDGARLAAGGGNNGQTRLYDDTGRLLHEVQEQPKVRDIVWSADGRHVLTLDPAALISRHAETFEPEWVAVQIGDRHITLSAAGAVLSGDSHLIDDHLVFIVDDDAGRRDVLTRTEFRERRAARLTLESVLP